MASPAKKQRTSADPDVDAGLDVLNAARNPTSVAPQPTAAPGAPAADPDTAAGLDVLNTAREYKPPPPQPPDNSPIVVDDMGRIISGSITGTQQAGRELSQVDDQYIRKLLAPAPNTTYGSAPWMPIARDNTTGAYRPALPSSLRDLAIGAYDLTQGPATGTVTPEGTGALATIAMGGGLNPSPAAGFGKAIGGRQLPPGSPGLGRNETPDFLGPQFRAEPALPLPENPLTPSATGPSEVNPLVPRTGPATPLRVEPTGGPRPGMGGGGATAEEIVARDAAAAANGWRPLRPDEALAPGQEVATASDGQQWVRQPVPQSAGAAATPTDLAGMTREEAAAAQARAEQYRLSNPRTTVNGHDDTQYVPGVRSTRAEITGSPVDASWERFYGNQVETKERFLKHHDDNGDAVKEYFMDGAKDRQILANADAARDAQATRDIAAAFGNKKPADAHPALNTVQEILSGPRNSENTYIRQYIGPIADRLQNADGTLKSDPEVLYGLREDLARKLKKVSQAADPNLGHVSDELRSVITSLDGVIESGAPGYRRYMDNYAAASRDIDSMQVLQDALPQLEVGAKKHFTFSSFDRFMKGVVDARQQPGVNPAKSLPPETMDRLWNIYAELHRKRTAEDLGAVRGSPTQPWLSQMAQVGAEGLGHAALLHFDQGGFANLALRGVVGAGKNMLQSSKTRNEVNRLLTPPEAP